MKTLVSRLSVACHHRSGKYSTWQGVGGGTCGLMGWLGVLGPAQPGPCLPATDLTSLDSAFQGPCRWCQGRVCVPEPGQCGFVGVEFGCLLRRVQEPALGVGEGAAKLCFVFWSVNPESQPTLCADLAAIDHLREPGSVPVEGHPRASSCGASYEHLVAKLNPPHPAPKSPHPARHPPAIPKL